VRARMALGSPELGREEEGATANSMAGREGGTTVRKPRAGRATPVSHSGHGERT
jgi:hypothetical protein